MNMAAVRSSGIYRTTPTTPVSSIRQVPSTTTTTTPVIKSINIRLIFSLQAEVQLLLLVILKSTKTTFIFLEDRN